MNGWAKVPIDLLAVVDGNALRVYVALCSYARGGGHCWPSDAALAERAGVSVPTVSRGLRQLVACGAVERSGRRKRVLRVVPVDALSIASDRNDATQSDHHRSAFRSPVIEGSRSTEVEITPPLRDVVSESEPDVLSADEEPMFEVDRLPEKPKPVTQASIAAFVEAYGTPTVSSGMLARIGRRVKELADTYGHDELVAACAELGRQKIANPNAIEAYVLRARQPRHREAVSRSQWSALAADTFAREPSPFA